MYGVKCDKRSLEANDKEIVEDGLELADKHMQYTQFLIIYHHLWSLFNFLFQNQSRQSLLKNSTPIIFSDTRHHWIVKSSMECKKGVINVNVNDS